MPLSRSRNFLLLDRPEYVQHVLVRHQDRYVRSFTYRPLKAFLGNGLITSLTRQQRAAIQKKRYRSRRLMGGR